jgi:hypothetical protein
MAITREDLLRAGIGVNQPMQAAPMPAQAAPQQPRGLLGGFFGPEGRDARARLAIGLEGMTLNPNQALIGQLEKGIERRETAAQKNATAEWLRSRGRDDLADAMQAGLPAAEALQMAMQPADPMAALEQEKLRLEVEGMRNPQPEFRRATAEEAAAYGAQGGQFGPDGRFYAVDVPQGMTIESDGQGGFRMVQGAGAATSKPFTEGQSKDVVYATRAQGALQVLEPVAEELTSLGSQVAGYDPTGIVRSRVQSPEYQVARNAGDEFLQAILRKDTGAAITRDEQTLYGETYLPQPGDGPEVLEAKRAARQRAVAAINAGMSPAQMIAAEKALGPQAGPPQGGPVRVANDAEYEALPSGTQFIGPDGKLRRKP